MPVPVGHEGDSGRVASPWFIGVLFLLVGTLDVSRPWHIQLGLATSLAPPTGRLVHVEPIIESGAGHAGVRQSRATAPSPMLGGLRLTR
jgi:hypothetical protein